MTPRFCWWFLPCWWLGPLGPQSHGDHLEPYWQRWQWQIPHGFFRKWPFIVCRYIIGDFLLPCLVMGALMGGWDPNWVLPATRVCWNEGSITWHPVANGIPWPMASRGQWHPMCIDFPVYFLIVISIVAWINKFIASFYLFFLSQCTLKNLITCWF